MKTYVGCKIVRAEPCSEHAFFRGQAKDFVPANPDRPGYGVVYPDGYTSWSPKAVFERTYREIGPSEAAMVSKGGEAA